MMMLLCDGHISNELVFNVFIFNFFLFAFLFPKKKPEETTTFFRRLCMAFLFVYDLFFFFNFFSILFVCVLSAHHRLRPIRKESSLFGFLSHFVKFVFKFECVLPKNHVNNIYKFSLFLCWIPVYFHLFFLVVNKFIN